MDFNDWCRHMASLSHNELMNKLYQCLDIFVFQYRDGHYCRDIWLRLAYHRIDNLGVLRGATKCFTERNSSVLSPSYIESRIFRKIGTISSYMVPWFLALPGHQQLCLSFTYGDQALVIYEGRSWLPAPSEIWEMMQSSSMFLCFLRTI